MKKKCILCGKEFETERIITFIGTTDKSDNDSILDSPLCDHCFDSNIILVAGSIRDPNRFWILMPEEIMNKAIESAQKHIDPRESFSSDDEYSDAVGKNIQVFLEGYYAGLDYEEEYEE